MTAIQKAIQAATRREVKTFVVRDVKMLDEAAGTFEAYLAVFGNVDSDNDVIQAGAFKKTLADHELKRRKNRNPFLFPVLWNHDENTVIGGCLDAGEDDIGLKVKCRLDLNVQKAAEIYSGLKLGYISTMSIGYDAVKRRFEGKNRILQEIRLWEGSVVTFPANDLAEVDLFSVKKQGVNTVTTSAAKRRRQQQKALSLDAALTMQTSDLQQEFADLWRAYLKAVQSQFYDYSVEDKGAAVSDLTDDFKEKLDALCDKAQEAGFIPMLDDDRDSFADPSDDDDDETGYMSRQITFGTKAGRALSKQNADAMNEHMTKMADAHAMIQQGMKDAVKAHKSLADYMAALGDPSKQQGVNDQPTNDAKQTAKDTGDQKTGDDAGKKSRTPQAENEQVADFSAFLAQIKSETRKVA